MHEVDEDWEVATMAVLLHAFRSAILDSQSYRIPGGHWPDRAAPLSTLMHR